MKIFAVPLLMAIDVLSAVQANVPRDPGSQDPTFFRVWTCKNPKGNDGESYTEGCQKITCKAGSWMSSPNRSICCYNWQPYFPNTTITVSKDGCATAVIYCKQEDDVVTTAFQMENNCGNHSTEEQVEGQMKHMEQTDCHSDSPLSTSTTSTTTNPSHSREGLVISGGYGTNTSNSVEMFIPSTKHSCTLPSLPDQRAEHTMSGLTICGGKYYKKYTTCLQLSSGVWSVSNSLQKERYGHSSWQSTQKGIILMGGDYGSRTSSEVVGQGGMSFDLRYTTMHACAISDGESFLLTGGVSTKQKVSRYNANGYVADLPGLNIGRAGHGCGAYINPDGTKVFLVAGGWDDSSKGLNSTELMLENFGVWSITSPLPRVLWAVQGVTLGNTFYMSGGKEKLGIQRDEILAWSDERKRWEEIGKMKNARSYHAITTINMEEVAAICG